MVPETQDPPSMATWGWNLQRSLLPFALTPYNNNNWDFPGGLGIKTAPPMQGAQVRSPVGELRSCMPQSVAKNLN